jgi:hypothetical protein
VLVALISAYVYGFTAGRTSRDDEVKVENAKYVEQVAEAFKVQAEYGNQKAAEVQEVERASAAKLTEVLTHVSKVTSNRACLSAPAVSLLNRASKGTGLPPSTRDDEEEDAGGIATDTDIAQWVAQAQDQYKKCAANNNGIIDIMVPPK